MIKFKFFAILLLPIIFLFSCKTTETIIIEDQYRLSSFSILDGSENLIQKVNITYNEMNKPAEIIAKGASGEVFNIKSMYYTNSGKLSNLNNSTDNSNYVKTEYFYDDSDFLIKVSITDEKGEALSTNTYINDERGNPVEWISKHDKSKEQIHFKMVYDDFNRVIESTELDADLSMIYYSASEYDPSGNELSYTIYSPEGNIDQQLLNFYFADELIETQVKDEQGNILFRTEYELNQLNKPINISSYNQYNDRTDWIDLEYDINGREILRKSFDFDGNLNEKIQKSYDEKGNLIEMIFYDENDQIISITRNNYSIGVLNMEAEEFNSLVYKY